MLRVSLFLFVILPLALTAQIQDSQLENRLSSIEMEVPLTYNSYVRAHINDYLRNDKSYTSKALARFSQEEKEIEQIISTYGLPKEIKYLALSLSGCSNFETSEEGGSGVYLMRYSVAKNKGLHISSYVDERRDIEKATHALCQELRELYAYYDDWHKTIAAYYASSLEMNRAISYSKDTLKRYWMAHSYLPFSYRKTVSKFIAAVYVAHFHKEHNIRMSPIMIVQTDTVPIRQHTSIQQIASRLEMQETQLKELNPTYKKQIIPNSGRPYFLVIPADKVSTFYALGDTVYMSKEEPKDTTENEEIEKEPELPPYTTIYYTVRSGDMLLNIADYYDTRLSTLKKWNGLRSDRINVNQRLKIVVPTNRLSYYKKINGMSRSEKRRIANKD
ncbi:MAG: LysM peptidoglycan-binding domain-containing protein [Bacteroidia bacterium]